MSLDDWREERESVQAEEEVELMVDIDHQEYKEPYEVELTAKGAGFFFERNFVMVVGENSAAEKAGMLKQSKILKLNDIEIKPGKHFQEVYEATSAPLRLTLAQLKSVSEAPSVQLPQEDSNSALSRSDLVGLILIYLSVMLDFFGSLMALPILPYFAKELDVDDSQLGLVIAAYQFAAIPGGLITLWCAEKWGTKYGILYSMFGTAGTLALAAFAWDFESLLAFRVIGGLTGNSVPVAITHIGIVVPNHLKAKYFSFIGVVITGSLIIAPAFGGMLIKYGSKVPWLSGGGIAFFGFLLTVAFLPNNSIPKKNKQDPGKFTAPMYATLVLQFFKTLPYTAVISMAVNYHRARFGLDGTDTGLILSVHGAIVCANNLVLLPFVRKCMGDSNRLLLLGYFLMASGYAIGTFMNEFWSFQICVSLGAGLGYGYIINSITPLADRWATPSTRAKIHSFGSMFDNLGFSAGAAIWGNTMKTGAQMRQDDPDSLFGMNLIWIAAAGTTAFCFFTALVLTICVYRPAERKQKGDKDAQANEAKKDKEVHYRHFKEEVGTEANFLSLGKAFGQMLTKRHYKWVSHQDKVLANLERFFPPLPIDTVENHYRAVREITDRAKACEEGYRSRADVFEEAFAQITEHNKTPNFH
mmetsp:Transcript_21801/g.43255  ORF Transcript_21801/g.43255 Transcript_21801/m.43255 type:complete len:642 (-) Transcript_21801:174-2099(-)